MAGTTSDTPPVAVTTVNVSGSTTASADNRGRFDGTIDGSISLWMLGLPCDRTASSTTEDIALDDASAMIS